MSLLIKGMDMPEHGIRHGAIVVSETGNHLVVNSHPYNKCFALSEIPTPHGDLINRDDLLAYFERKSKGKSAEEALKLLYTALKAYPTVIEKEMNQ